MDSEALRSYKQQLDQVNHALIICSNEDERNELQSLKNTIEELLSLSNEGSNEPSTSNDRMEDEFALFMAEMENEGVVERKNLNENICKVKIPKDIEGKKCRAPHRHQWGDVAYHNAMVCSVIPDDDDSDFKVRVLFTNPTHQEMLPCPYFFDSDCKFSEEKCRFSHGEIVPYSSLQEYIEPKFELLKVGSVVLTKQLSNIWRRAKIKQIYEDKCLVRLESDKKQIEVNFEHVLPLDNDRELDEESSDSEAENDDTEEADIINNSLMVTPCDNKLGDWEKYTKGVGSRLMNKMGYIVGTGLGKNADGRIDPISAVVLPAGKSLDHCMKLREESGGDKDLFSVERKLQRLQKKQEKQNQRIYEQQAKNHDVFNFINKTLDRNGAENEVKNKLQERQKIKQECSRNLNIRSLQIAEDIRKTEKDLEKLKDSLGRHDASSNVYIKLKDKLMGKQDQLKVFQSQALVIRNEQNLRNDKKKMTVF